MDNAAFHKSEKTKKIIADAQCTLLFLPPYSPDLNPIEQFWANLKANIKKIIGQFNNLAGAIDNIFNQSFRNQTTIKANANHFRFVKTIEDLSINLRYYLTKIQFNEEKIKRFFEKKETAYAAW